MIEKKFAWTCLSFPTKVIKFYINLVSAISLAISKIYNIKSQKNSASSFSWEDCHSKWHYQILENSLNGTILFQTSLLRSKFPVEEQDKQQSFFLTKWMPKKLKINITKRKLMGDILICFTKILKFSRNNRGKRIFRLNKLNKI